MAETKSPNRHAKKNRKDTEQLRAQILEELSALTNFRLKAEETVGEGLLYVRFLCFGNGNLVAAHDDSDGFNRKVSYFTYFFNSIFAICNPTVVAND